MAASGSIRLHRRVRDLGLQPVDRKAQLERGRKLALQLRAKGGWQVVMEADGQRVE